MNHLQIQIIALLQAQVNMDWNSEDSNLLVITYNFEAPESSIGAEKRIVDINPNFSSQCYTFNKHKEPMASA